MIRSAVFMFLFVSAALYAQETTNRNNVLSVQHTEDFEVTGDGTAPAWSTTEWIDLRQIKGSSSYTTQAKLLYSDKGIYALYRCDDKKITSTLREDFTSLWKEDVVEIFFWPDESFPIYFEYELSPNNYELAILVPNLNGHASGWTPWNYKGEKKTRHATKIFTDKNQNATGWMAEIFIPYKLLSPLQNVPPEKGTRWRANIYRIDYDNTESTYWAWQLVDNNFHEYKRYGVILFD